QGEIEGVIAAHVQLAERVVDRQGEARDRPAAEDGPRRRGERTRERPQLPDVGVAQDCGPIVEDKGRRQAVRPRARGERRQRRGGGDAAHPPRPTGGQRAPTSRSVLVRTSCTSRTFGPLNICPAASTSI